MSAFLVSVANSCGKVFRNGANAVLVFAASDTIAKQMASALFDGDGSGFDSADATATEVLAASDWAGWTFNIRVSNVGAVSVLADATTNTIDEVGAALVTALNALAGIANASYNSTTQVLTIAAIADDIGDEQVYADIIPPGCSDSIAGLVGAIVDGGIAGAALTLALPADAAVVPSVPVALKVC